MNKPLEAGQWCKPKDEKEWRAVLDLAEALGIGGYQEARGYRFRYTSIACIDAIDGQFVRGWHEASDNGDRYWTASDNVSVQNFISGMYALAEKKGDRATELHGGPLVDPDRIKAQIETVSDIKSRLHALEVKSALFDDILKRLSAIEADPLRNKATKLSTGAYAVEKSLVDIIRSAADTNQTHKRLSELESWRDKIIKAAQ